MINPAEAFVQNPMERRAAPVQVPSDRPETVLLDAVIDHLWWTKQWVDSMTARGITPESIDPHTPVSSGDLAFWDRVRESYHAIAERACQFLGFAPFGASLAKVPDALGGGFIVKAAGPCRGPVGCIAHIDLNGWILRVGPDATLQYPPVDAPIPEVLARLVDDPIRPGLGRALQGVSHD